MRSMAQDDPFWSDWRRDYRAQQWGRYRVLRWTEQRGDGTTVKRLGRPVPASAEVELTGTQW
jgi:hypothetical protein